MFPPFATESTLFSRFFSRSFFAIQQKYERKGSRALEKVQQKFGESAVAFSTWHRAKSSRKALVFPLFLPPEGRTAAPAREACFQERIRDIPAEEDSRVLSNANIRPSKRSVY